MCICAQFCIFVAANGKLKLIKIMKRLSLCFIGLMLTVTSYADSGINYDGSKLTYNTEFTRTECGTMKKNVMPETSGLACSRTTPGYLWAHGDENLGDNRKIVAVKPDGTLAMTVKIDSDTSDRDDWEDIATGVYDSKNLVFIGAFGDNDLQYKDNYFIYFLEEPAITSGTQTLSVSAIRFGYPDNKAHNAETLMYDNIEQMIYVADKVKDGICTLYRMPFRTDYGTERQTLTKVCELGNGSSFNFLTAGDISPDGRWMAIKSKKHVLLWERQGNESLSETAQRRPVQIKAYEKETQGESIAWADASTFYTTSDDKNDVPIYSYVRTMPSVTGVETITNHASPITNKIIHNGQLFILRDGKTYNLTGVQHILPFSF